jgi:hypothetical protein
MKDQIRLIEKAVWRHRYYHAPISATGYRDLDYLPLKMGLGRNVIPQTVGIYLHGRRKSSRVLSLYCFAHGRTDGHNDRWQQPVLPISVLMDTTTIFYVKM